MDDHDQERLYALPEVRVRLGNIGQSTLYELLKTRQLGSVKIGARRFVSARQLATYIDAISDTKEN